MKVARLVLIILVSGLVLSGCSTYKMVSIPDTPDALAAYRQCMTMQHLSFLPSCMAGVPGVRYTPTSSSEYRVTDGCRMITVLDDYWGDVNHYIEIQACPDNVLNPPPPPMP